MYKYPRNLLGSLTGVNSEEPISLLDQDRRIQQVHLCDREPEDLAAVNDQSPGISLQNTRVQKHILISIFF